MTTTKLDLAGLNLRMNDLPGRMQVFRDSHDLAEVAEILGIGLPTLTDIVDALVRPGRDPREDLPAPVLRRDVLSLDDLQEGMVLTGTVGKGRVVKPLWPLAYGGNRIFPLQKGQV